MRFQSLGSQYNFRDAWHHLVARGTPDAHTHFADALESRYKGQKAYLYANGRSALSAAVAAFATASDEIAVNGFTCYVVQEAVIAAGATPHFLDIDSSTLHFSDRQLHDALTSHPNLRAIVVQNSFGIACDIVSIEAFAREHRLILIEDLAHCAGLIYPDGREAGTVGDFTMLSFGRDKLLDCVSGGALVVRNAAYVDKVQSPAHLASRTNRLRDRWYPLLMWLARTTYPIYLGPLLTRFYRATRMVVRTADGSIDILAAMPSWQAKRAQQKLNDLAADIDRRQQLAALYREKLPSLFHPTDAPVRLPFLAKNRDNVWRRLQRAGYHMSDTWYDTPIGPARLYGKVNYPETRCPTAAEVAARIINLPTHRYINVDHATRIAEIVLESQRESA